MLSRNVESRAFSVLLRGLYGRMWIAQRCFVDHLDFERVLGLRPKLKCVFNESSYQKVYNKR